MKIYKKTWPEYFEKILSGDKQYDVRVADFDVKEGDILVLEEYDPEIKNYTGRVIEKVVSYVGKIKDWNFFKKEDVDKYGLVVMSLKD